MIDDITPTVQWRSATIQQLHCTDATYDHSKQGPRSQNFLGKSQEDFQDNF